ncbi:LysM peptidoglycan-binding domain-containing protein [Alcanivorax sp. 1008]|uniref:LysM peptidoglycan-binding domain-containing protein n=1 Tax=Alcanivorax sp. 1008 TaxID=2816853 RepID=UPI001E612496
MDTLAAVATTGNIYISEADGLNLTTVADFDVTRIGLDSSATPTAVGALSNVLAGNHVKIETVANGLTVTDTVTATGGDLLLDAAGDLAIDNAVAATAGNASLIAGGAITQAADGDVSVAGNLDVEAGGAITMNADASSTSTGGGNMRYLSTVGDITLGVLNTGTGNVRVQALSGSIVDGRTALTNVSAVNLQLLASANVGAAGADALDVDVDTLAAVATTGNIYISEADGLNLTTVADFNVTRIGLDSSATPTAVGALSNVLAANNVKIEAVTNGLTVTDTVTATGGDLLLDAAGDLAIDNAVAATAGNASLIAGGAITQAADGDVTVGGTLDVNAQGGDITMTNGAISAATGNIRYLATGDIRLASLNGANVRVESTGGSIIDNGDADVDIIALTAQLQAANSIGEPNASNNGLLETTVGTLGALATTGGIYIDETDALVIGSVPAIDVFRIGIDSSSTNQPGGVLAGVFAGTDVIIRANNDLTVDNGVFAIAGDLLLRSQAGNVQLNAGVTASAGNATIDVVNGTLGQSADGDITAGSDIYVDASGTITMDDGALSNATGNLFYGSGADLLIGGLAASDVLVDVTGSIIDNGDAHVDVVATTTQLRAGASIGEAAGTNNGPLETTVTTLAATAGTGNIYISETDALEIGSVAAIDVNSVGLNAGVTLNPGALLEGALAAQNLKVEAVAGGITVSNAVDATNADLLLDAQGGDLAINATVDAGGNASLLASANVTQSADGDVTVGGTLDVEARGGDIDMTDGAISSAVGNIRYEASADILLASVSGADVEITAGASIIDNGEMDVDVIATNAQLVAGSGLDNSIGEVSGTNNGPLEITVEVIAAQALQGNVYLSETDDLEIGFVAPIDVNRVGIDSSAAFMPASQLTGIQASAEIDVEADDILVVNEVRSFTGNILLRARDGGIDQTGATLIAPDLNQIIAMAGDIEMIADNGDILLQRVSADGNTVTLTASGQILNDNLGPDLAGQVNVIADTLIASANDAIGVTAAGQFTDPTNEQRLITEVENDIQVFLAQAGTVAIDNTSTDGSVDVVFNLPLADASNGSSVWVRSTEALRALGLEFATESGGVEFDGNLQLLAVNGDLTLNEAQVGDANDVNLVAQWMRLEAARGAFRNGDTNRFQQVGDGLGLTADELVLITGGDLGVSATVDSLNVIGTGLYQVAVGGTPGTGGENADLDLQLSRRDIALVDEAIRFETIIIDRQGDPAPSWIADLDTFFQGLGAAGWQENVFGLFTTGTARVISLRQDDGVNTTHDGSIRFVDDVEAGQLSLPADLTIEVRAGEFGTDYAGTIYVDSGVTFVAQNVGTPVTGTASIFGNVLIDGSLVVQEDRSVELQGRGGDIIIDSDESAAGRVLLSPGLGFDVIFTNAATFTVTQGLGAEGDLVILSARNVVMDPDTAIIADGSVLIGADNITGDVVLAEGGTAVQGDVILYNVTGNANGNGIGDVVVYTTGEAAGDTYSFDFGNGAQTYEISGRIVLGRQDVFDNLITELTNDPLFLDNPANIPAPAVQAVNVRLIAADSIESGWAVDYDAGLLPEQELVHVVATETMELRAINGTVGGTVAPQGVEGLTPAEQPLRVVVGDLMRLGAGDYDRYATSVNLVGTAERFEEIRLTPGLITFNSWQIGGNLEPKFVSGTGPDASAYVMAGYGELERRPAQAGVALSHGTDNALQLISFVPGQPEPLTALWVVDDSPFGNVVLDKPEEEPVRGFVVRRGDTLWDLAEEFLGDAQRWEEIWWLTTPHIDNPDLIEPGQEVILGREQIERLEQIREEEEAEANP